MFKNLKGLKLISKKKEDSSSKEKHKPARPRNKPRITALKKFKETMGNLAPSMFHGQHYVENVEEHATAIMKELERMRHNGTMCDLTIPKCDGTKMQAHKIVVSFNEKLLEITSQTPEVNGSQIGSDISCEKYDEANLNRNDNSVIVSDEEELCRLASVTSEGDLVKGLNGDDVIVGEVPGSPEPKTSSADNVIQQEGSDAVEVDDVIPSNDCDVVGDETAKESGPEKDDVAKDNGVKTENGDDVTTGETKVEEESALDDSLPPPMIGELCVPTENDPNKVEANGVIVTEKTEYQPLAKQKIEAESCDVIIESDDVVSPRSFEDPLEVLINFFYTSHINITTKNVIKLRVVARQCEMNDITMACNEFENVLRAETENMTTEKEKEETASQFRYQYSDPQMAIKMLEHFENLRSHSRHTDVTVTSPTTSFPAHSPLLVAASAFFADKFEHQKNDIIKTNVTSDATTDVIIEVAGPDVKDPMLQNMMMYFYTAKIPVSSSSAKELMEAADMLKCRDVTEGCAEFLERTLSVQNCIEIQTTAEKYNCAKLKKLAARFIESNFFAVSRTNEFLSVTKEWISSIVASHKLLVDHPASDGEFQIFEAVRKWVNHDLENRKTEVFEAMSEVRIPLISDNHLINDISTDLLIMEDDALCSRVSGIITGKSTCKFDESVSMRGDEYILMIGGSAPVDDETSDDLGYTAVAFSDYVTMYDVVSGRMHELTYLPETRSLHCALAFDHYIIVAGGFDKYSCITNEVHCLDLASLTWTKLPAMKVKRACFTMFYLDGCIYAAGGLTPTGYSCKVERYNRNKTKWEYVAQLPKTYYRHAGCVYHGELLITGGNDKCTDAMKYSPSSDSWRMMKPMNVGRDSHAMVTAANKVFVIGGDVKVLSVEEYNSATECWQIIPYVHYDPIYLSGATAFGNNIYLIGGWKADDDALDDVKCLDASTETWIPTSTRMKFPRGSLTATTVRMPKSYVGKTVPMTQKPQP